MRFVRSFLTLVLALFAVFLAVPVWAAEEGIKAGMPQLDFQFYLGEIFWLAVTFALLYVLMSRFALPGVERTQKKRQALIAADLASANTANEAAKKIIEEYEAGLASARAQATTNEGIAAAAKESMLRQAEQQKVLAKKVQDAEQRIAKSRDAAMQEVQKISVEIANSVIEKVTGLKMQVKA